MWWRCKKYADIKIWQSDFVLRSVPLRRTGKIKMKNENGRY
jgi:hypothetical protein